MKQYICLIDLYLYYDASFQPYYENIHTYMYVLISCSRKFRFYELFIFTDILLSRVFEVLKTSLSKHDLRYLMKKFRFPDDKVQELETVFHGKDQLEDRVYHAFLYWREVRGPMASLDELIRVLHITNMEELSQQIKTIKVYSQALKL